MTSWWAGLDSSAQAAWAQFVAATLGLGIAIAVPWATGRAQRKEQKRREQDRARDIALAILQDVRTMRDKVAQLYHCIGDDLPSHIRTPLMMGDGIAMEDWLGIPDSIEARLHEMHALGDAAKPVQHMLLLYRELIGDVQLTLLFQEMKLDPEVRSLRLRASECWRASRNAYAAIFALFSEVRPAGPEPELVEPPIPTNELSKLFEPPKPPGA